MKRYCTLSVAVVALVFSIRCTSAEVRADDDAPKNPFGIKLEPVPDDEEVQRFAKAFALTGGDRDENAAQWVEAATDGMEGAVDGEWSGRWRYAGRPWVNQVRPTKFATVGDRVYILFTYHEGPYLIVAKREVLKGEGEMGERLVGRYMSTVEPRETGPWVGLFVDNERIDGQWQGITGSGRWDFRRKIKE